MHGRGKKFKLSEIRGKIKILLSKLSYFEGNSVIFNDIKPLKRVLSSIYWKGNVVDINNAFEYAFVISSGP